LEDPKRIAEWKAVAIQWLFLWNKREIELKEKHKNKLFNLSFLLFQRPKNNRRTESSGDCTSPLSEAKRQRLFLWNKREIEWKEKHKNK